MFGRLKNYYRSWRGRGAAKMDHYLWLHWAITGRYPNHKSVLERVKHTLRIGR